MTQDEKLALLATLLETMSYPPDDEVVQPEHTRTHLIAGFVTRAVGGTACAASTETPRRSSDPVRTALGE